MAGTLTGAARVLIAALALFASGSAQAQASRLLPYAVSFNRFSLVTGGGPTGVERVVTPGDVVMTTRIGYAAAARTTEPISLTLVGTPVSVPAGTSILQATAVGGTIGALPRTARIFCVRSIRLPETRDQERLRDTVRPCFVDSDRDGRFDRAFLEGARRFEDRARMTVMTAGYVLETDLPLPNSYAEITFEQGGDLQGPILQLNIFMDGQHPPIQAIRAEIGGRMRGFALQRTVRRSAYPHTIVFATAQIAITGYEPDGRRLRLRIDHAFESIPFEFVLVDNVIIR